MAVNFGKVFGVALRYPPRRDVYSLLFGVSLIFSVISWFIMGVFIGDLSIYAGSADISGILMNLVSMGFFLAPVLIIGWIVGILLMGMYIDNSMKFFRGKREYLDKSYKRGKERFLSLLGTTVIIILILVVCLGGAAVFFILPLALNFQNVVLIAIGTIWLIIGTVIGIIILFMAYLAPEFCVLEKTGPMESIRKSWKLVSKNKLSTFLFLIIFIVIYSAIAIAGSIPENIYTLLFGAYPLLSTQSLGFLIFRSIFSVYLVLFMYSAKVNYFLSIKKKFGMF